MDHSGPFNLISLCAGVGGLDLGVHIARGGCRTVAYVEREAAAIETLAARMEDGTLSPAPVWSDLTTFDGRPWRGVVDCITSGDPCQPNSVAGKRLGDADDRWLADHVIRIIDEIRPSRVFRENVPGNADGQLGYFIPALERLGYRVAVGIFSASEVGFSHRRERLFIMADRNGEGLEGEQRGEHNSKGWKKPDGPPSLCDRAEARDDMADSTNPNGGSRVGGTQERVGSHGRGRRGQGGSEPTRQFGVISTVEPNSDVGNPDDGAHGRNTEGAGRGSVGRTAADGPGAQAVERYVDDTDDRRHGVKGGEIRSGRNESFCSVELPIAAPGPSDPRWPAIIAHAPHLEPAICRVDARMADRIDRLRAAGNGVSSLAAAFAWRTLENTLATG